MSTEGNPFKNQQNGESFLQRRWLLLKILQKNRDKDNKKAFYETQSCRELTRMSGQEQRKCDSREKPCITNQSSGLKMWDFANKYESSS